MPRVSVIIPTYNRAHIVGGAIDSVLSQTFTDFELIVVDDGSTDRTEALIRHYGDARLKYIKQVNRGVSAARNAGLDASSGQFIAFLDSDDRYLPEKLAAQVALMDSDAGLGLVYARYFGATASGERKIQGSCDSQLQLRQLLLGPAFHTSTMLIRRSWLDRAGGFDESLKVGEEWELSLRLVLAGCRVACLPRPVSEVQLQPDGLTRQTYRHGQSVSAVLDKIFNSPQMPQEMLESKDLFYASLFIRHAVSAYLAEDWATGQELLKRSLFLVDPTLESREGELLIARFVSHLKGLCLGDPEAALRSVTDHLPGEAAFAARLERKLWQNFYLESAFIAYSLKHRLSCIRYGLRLIAMSPSFVRDRGLMSILFQSLLGSRKTERLKSLKHPSYTS